MWYVPNGLQYGSNDVFYDVFRVQNAATTIIAIGPHCPSRWIDNKQPQRHRHIHPLFTLHFADNTGNDHQIAGIVEKDPHSHTLLVQFIGVPISCSEVRIENTNAHWSRTYTVNIFPSGPVSEGCAAMSTIIKNESKYIVPWVDYHLSIGFDRIFIYDNASSDRDALLDKLQDYISAQQVVVIDWPFPYMENESGLSGQTTQQNHSIRGTRDRFDWLALTDIDEYIVPMKTSSVKSLLEPYKKDATAAAVSVRCLWFGCGGTVFEADSFLYTQVQCARDPEPEKQRPKCIVKPSLINMFSVHVVLSSVAGTFVKYLDAYEEARFNHYFTLSAKNRQCDHQKYDVCTDKRILDLLPPVTSPVLSGHTVS